MTSGIKLTHDPSNQHTARFQCSQSYPSTMPPHAWKAWQRAQGHYTAVQTTTVQTRGRVGGSWGTRFHE